MKEWTIKYSHTPPRDTDWFHCEAETEEEAMEKFDAATADSDDVEVEEIKSKPYIDPNQMSLFGEASA